MKTVFLAGLLAASTGGATRAQTFYLDLNQQTLDVPGRVVRVEQVLDGRAGPPPIGIAYRAGRAAAIGFWEGVAPALTAFVLSQLPGRPTDHPVVLCLRRLHLSETLGGPKEQATADLAADVYEHLPDGYHFVQAVAAQASSEGREVTYRHAPHMAQLLAQCLAQLGAANWAAVAARPVRPLTDPFHAAALAQSQGRTGLIAGAVGAALVRTNVPDHTAEPMPFGLDMMTGALGPYPGIGIGTPLRPDTAFMYFYRPVQAADAQPVGVFVDGRELGALRPGQYLEVPWARFGKPMRLCLNGVAVANSCQLLVPNAAQLNYLKISTGPAAQPWQWMPPAQGAADLNELDRQAKQTK